MSSTLPGIQQLHLANFLSVFFCSFFFFLLFFIRCNDYIKILVKIML